MYINKFPNVNSENWSRIFGQYVHIDAKGNYVTTFDDVIINSVYQPIFSYQSGVTQCVGFEALMRAYGPEGYISPDAFMNRFDGDNRYFLDRVLRIIHIRNFIESDYSTMMLFLNADPYACINYVDMKEGLNLLIDRLNEFNIDIGNIVFELIEHPAVNDDVFCKSVEHLRRLGIKLAVDDYGTNCSDINRVRMIRPDIVKLDRSWLVNARNNPKTIDDFLDNVQLLRESGSKILIEGVEFKEDVELVGMIKPEYVQGYWYGIPEPLNSKSRIKLINSM